VVELQDDAGLKRAAVVFQGVHAEHPGLGAGLNAVRGAMASPSVPGLAPLLAVDGAAWVYASGTAWTVAEIVQGLADVGAKGSVRAGLELCYLVADTLLEASEETAAVGIGRHGSLDPTRVMVRSDGQIVLLGYGLPPVDVSAWLDNPRPPLSVEALRYSPPERLRGDEEDLSSDLYALTLIGLELMVGRPVYDGQREDIEAQARDGRADQRIYGFGALLPPMVQQAVGQALKPDCDARFATGEDYLYAMHSVLASVDAKGKSLTEVLAEYRGLISRSDIDEARGTGQYTPSELAELTADLGAIEKTSLPPPRVTGDVPEPEVVEEEPASRWAKVVGEAASTPPSTDPRERLRRRREEANSGGEESARDRLKRRVRSGPKAAPTPESPRARRRIRDHKLPAAEEPAVSEATPEPEIPPAAVPTPTPAPVEADAAESSAESSAPEPAVEVEPVPGPVEVGPLSAVAAAAALLQRLRAGDDAPEVVEEASAQPPVAVDEPDDAAADTVAVSGPSTAESNTPASGYIRVGAPDGRSVDVPVVGQRCGQVAFDAAIQLGLPTHNLGGQLMCAWSIAGVRQGQSADTLAGEHALLAVQNVVSIREIVVGPEGGTTRFRAPVGQALRVHQLLAHLADWLELSGPLKLQVAGRVASAGDLIVECGEGVLTVRVDK
jgi:hypothetical protein